MVNLPRRWRVRRCREDLKHSRGRVESRIAQHEPVTGCGTLTTGTWAALPFDGTVERITVTNAYQVRDGCSGAVWSKCLGTWTVGPLGRDADEAYDTAYALATAA